MPAQKCLLVRQKGSPDNFVGGQNTEDVPTSRSWTDYEYGQATTLPREEYMIPKGANMSKATLPGSTCVPG
jgi:hypothetical protein